MALTQILGQGLVLLTLLGGIVAALVMVRRAPAAARLVIAGCALGILTRIGSSIVFALIRSHGVAAGRDAAETASSHAVSSFVDRCSAR